MIYDLHTHSDCSDGELSPRALVDLAKINGVDVLALTDHDTVSGIEAAQKAAGSDIRLIAGIEFSTQWLGRSIHIVGLQVDPHSEKLKAAVEDQAKIRHDRAVIIGHRLERFGVKDALDGARRYARHSIIGRPHFARYMVNAGYVKSVPQAFQQYLGSGKVGDVKENWPTMAAAVQWIHHAGGIAVLAHPDKYKLTRTKLYQLLQDFADAGGQAMEVVSGHQKASVTVAMTQAAKDFSLLLSCGSDFHGPSQTWLSVGKYSSVPDDCEPVWRKFR